MKRARVLLVAESLDSPSTFYRLRPLAATLRRGGLEVMETGAGSGAVARRSVERQARSADLVVLQRRLWALFDVSRLRRACRRLVYDIDDAVCYKDGARGRFFSPARRLKFRALCRRADLVVAGNTYLSELAARHGAARTMVIPTCVPAVAEGVGAGRGEAGRGTKDNDIYMLVWIGGRATRRYLEDQVEMLRCLAPAGGRVALRIVADRRPDLPGVASEFVEWSRAIEGEVLSAADCGIAPLPDDPWTRGKCGLKLLQYGAWGLPSIASPVGVQQGIIADGETGILARGPARWKAALDSLIDDPAAAARMGQCALERVARRYLWARHETRWLEAIERQLRD